MTNLFASTYEDLVANLKCRSRFRQSVRDVGAKAEQYA